MIKNVKPLVLQRFKGDPPSVTCGGNKTTTLVPATTTPIPMPATSTEFQNGMLMVLFDLFLLPKIELFYASIFIRFFLILNGNMLM